MRFKPYNLLAPSDPKWGVNTDQIMEYIDQHPGQTSGQIIKDTGLTIGTVRSTLSRRTYNGTLKVKKLDGANRYYPSNYKFSDEFRKYDPKTETQAKNWVWETEPEPHEIQAIKKFLEWLKGKE